MSAIAEAPQQEILLNLEPHDGQMAVFHNCKARKRVCAKGRRWGFTRGAAEYVIEQMLEGVSPIMWGDTIVANIHSYVERYFLPILNKLPSNIYDWKKAEKKLYVGNSVCDFRSADQPENWEGFGYKIIILNEAGIILKNLYLYYNAVRPMLMDHPDSIAIIGGTPKGKNLFYELWLKADTDPEWAQFQYSSFTNPYLNREEIDSLVAEVPDTVARQEIYAEFTDTGDMVLIPYDLIRKCMEQVDQIEDDTKDEVWGLDIARHGEDLSCLTKRYWKYVYDIKTHDIQDTMQLASFVAHEYRTVPVKPFRIFVETTGIGWGVYDRCRELGLPVTAADVSLKSFMQGVYNKRAEMYVRLKQEMEKGLKIIDDRRALRQLSNVHYKFNNKSEIQLLAKEDIKSTLGESPDIADSIALTYYEDVTFPESLKKTNDRYKIKVTKGQRSWMSN